MNAIINGKRVSRIGLGCVTFGREIDEAASFALMDHAHASGVIFFDTASAYGAGASERIVGAWLASRWPESLVVATKILPPFTREKISADVDESLQRLGADALDLLYLHRWDASLSLESLASLDVLVRTGKVRALGASNFNATQLANAIRLQSAGGLTPFSVVQNNHNLAVSDLTPEFRAVCAKHAFTVVTYSPLGAGFLTGKHQRGVQPGSRFALVPGHQEVYFHEDARRRLARLESVAVRTDHTQAHLALAWALHQPGVTSVLVGGRTPAHLDQALAAQTFDDPAIFAELNADLGLTQNTFDKSNTQATTP